MGISNTDSCFTATTLFTVVVARLVFSIMKFAISNCTQGTDAVNVTVFDKVVAIAQENEEFMAFANSVSVVA